MGTMWMQPVRESLFASRSSSRFSSQRFSRRGIRPSAKHGPNPEPNMDVTRCFIGAGYVPQKSSSDPHMKSDMALLVETSQV